MIGACALIAGFAFVIGFSAGLNVAKDKWPMASRIRKIAGSPDDLSKCNPAHIVSGNYCFDWYEAY
jgi:hypothetical protein